LAPLVATIVRQQLLSQVEPRLEREVGAEGLRQGGRLAEVLDRRLAGHPRGVRLGEGELDAVVRRAPLIGESTASCPELTYCALVQLPPLRPRNGPRARKGVEADARGHSRDQRRVAVIEPSQVLRRHLAAPRSAAPQLGA